MASLETDDTEKFMSLERFNLCNKIYAEKRRIWKLTAPPDLLHQDGDCGKCWLEKQDILYFNPAIYVYDGINPRISHERLVELYETNVASVRSCGCHF